MLVLACTGCHQLIPEAPPPESPVLMPDDFAWDELDLAQTYTYIHNTKVDCGYMQNAIASTGRCVPQKKPYGSVIVCPLAKPASSLEIGCLENEHTPDLMVRMSFEYASSDIDFSSFGPCHMVADGPANNQDKRYKTDPGYKACLFEQTTPPGQLSAPKGSERPVGIYLDLSDHPLSAEELSQNAASLRFSVPVTLVLDTRFLDENMRQEAFQHITDIFNYYRAFKKPESEP